MPAGMQVINDHGSVLIDDNNPSLSLRQKTASSTSSVLFPGVNYANAEFPQCAFSSTEYLWLNNEARSGTNRTWQFQREWGAFGTMTATFFVFDRPVDSGIAGGLKLWDASGRLTFDAYGKYGRVAHVQVGNGSWTGVPGRQYAAIIASEHYYQDLILHPDISVGDWKRRRWYRTGVAVAGHIVYVNDILVDQFDYVTPSPPEVFDDYGTPRVVILDVTGY